MPGSNRISLRSIHGLAAIALGLAGCSSLAGAPTAGALNAPDRAHAAQLGRTLGKPACEGFAGSLHRKYPWGVPPDSTGKNPHEVGDITDGLPRVTSVWVDQTGVLYAFTDNRQYPYETIEEFKAGGTSPFFSLVLKRYGDIVAADLAQNVYAQGENGQGQQVIDVYPPGSQNYANEYVVPSIGRASGPQGMAFDSTGTLLVGVAALADNKQGQVGAVFRLNAGSSTFINLNLEKAYGGLIATDEAGNLLCGRRSVDLGLRAGCKQSIAHRAYQKQGRHSHGRCQRNALRRHVYWGNYGVCTRETDVEEKLRPAGAGERARSRARLATALEGLMPFASPTLQAQYAGAWP